MNLPPTAQGKICINSKVFLVVQSKQTLNWVCIVFQKRKLDGLLNVKNPLQMWCQIPPYSPPSLGPRTFYTQPPFVMARFLNMKGRMYSDWLTCLFDPEFIGLAHVCTNWRSQLVCICLKLKKRMHCWDILFILKLRKEHNELKKDTKEWKEGDNKEVGGREEEKEEGRQREKEIRRGCRGDVGSREVFWDFKHWLHAPFNSS